MKTRPTQVEAIRIASCRLRGHLLYWSGETGNLSKIVCRECQEAKAVGFMPGSQVTGVLSFSEMFDLVYGGV